MNPNEPLETIHEHFLETKDDDFICIDVVRSYGHVISVGWYTAKKRDVGQHSFLDAA